MATPPIPPALEHLAARPFSFYPAIVGIEHNEWRYRKGTWSEILVLNCRTEEEIWIPRRFIGEVSRSDDPVLIVGLNRELEYKAGAVWPFQRRVLQMPPATPPPPKPADAETPTEAKPAPVVGIRLEPNDKRIFRLIAIALAVAIGLYAIAVNLNRVGEFRQRNVVFTASDQSFLDLNARDTFASVVSKLGQPAQERAQEVGTIHYRALAYPDRRYTVILMGPDRETARYIGVMDDNWEPLHSVDLHSGGTTLSLLRGLKRF
jgi:hypothetical protein